MILICGVPGTGKSTLLRVLLEERCRVAPVYALDLWDAFDGNIYRATPDLDYPSKHEIVCTGPALPWPILGSPVVYRPHGIVTRTAEAFAVGDNFVWQVGQRGGIIAMDEIADVLNPAARLLSPAWARAAIQARKAPVLGLAVACQKARQVHPEVRTAVRVLYLLRQTQRLDLDAVCEMIPDVHHAMILKMVPTLPDLTYLKFELSSDRAALYFPTVQRIELAKPDRLDGRKKRVRTDLGRLDLRGRPR